jgi:hypothetical protein
VEQGNEFNKETGYKISERSKDKKGEERNNYKKKKKKKNQNRTTTIKEKEN